MLLVLFPKKRQLIQSRSPPTSVFSPASTLPPLLSAHPRDIFEFIDWF